MASPLFFEMGPIAGDSSEESLLLDAAWEDMPEAVRKILANERIQVNSVSDEKGSTALHTAALLGHEKIVELLLADQRVNVNCRDLGGHTPLHLAAGCGYDEVVQLLRDCDRVEVACENKSGMTAFGYARDMGLQDIKQLFLSNARFAEVHRSAANSGASIFKLIEAAAAEREDPEKSCWHCHKCPVELSVCKGCKKARYCDEKCQNEDWAEHEAFCRKRQRRQKRKQRKEEKSKKKEHNDEDDGGDGLGEDGCSEQMKDMKLSQ